jgi:hypothetical protein
MPSHLLEISCESQHPRRSNHGHSLQNLIEGDGITEGSPNSTTTDDVGDDAVLAEPGGLVASDSERSGAGESEPCTFYSFYMRLITHAEVRRRHIDRD